MTKLFFDTFGYNYDSKPINQAPNSKTAHRILPQPFTSQDVNDALVKAYVDNVILSYVLDAECPTLITHASI